MTLISTLTDFGQTIFNTLANVRCCNDRSQKGKGTVGVLLSDTVASESLARSIHNIEQGTDNFNKNMEALKSNFLFRKYYRKQKRGSGK